MRDERRQALLEEALNLRVPAVDELNKPLGSVRLDSLRVAGDAKRTEQMISAGIASRFQRRTHLPRKDGRKLPTVIQLHPEGAPEPRERAPRNGARRTYRAPASVRPSVEELRELIERIALTESELLEQRTRAISERISETKRRLVDLGGEAEANAIRELHELTQARASMAADIRREAFAKIEADAAFPARRWLALLSLDRPG